jgi:integrase
MSVRKWERKQANGKVREVWMVDVQFEHADGRIERVRKVQRTQRAAERYERQLRHALESGTFRKEESQTLGAYEAKYIERAELLNKPGSVTEKRSILRNHLLPAFGRMRLQAIRVQDLEGLAAKLKKDGLAIKTIANVLGVMHNILHVAYHQKLIPNPPPKPELPADNAAKEEIDFLTFEEAERLVAHAPSFWRPMIVLALETALRRGELRGLTWEDVDFANKRLTVRRNIYRGVIGSPKGGRTRQVDLTDKAVDILRGLRHLRGPYVFCNEDGSYLKSDACRKGLDAAAKAAGLRPIGWHTLRHACASHLVMLGAPLKAVQELLGHADIKTTTRYAHLTPTARKGAVALLDSRRNGNLTATTSEGAPKTAATH